MPRILALDSATEICSVALMDGAREKITLEAFVPQRQAECILPMVDQVLTEAGLLLSQLDAIAFGQGPGSFIGLRVASSVAQGLAFGADLPVISISSLQALAQNAYEKYSVPSVMPAIDARMQAIYWGYYQLSEEGLMEATIQDSLSAPAEVNCPGIESLLAAGNGWRVYENQFRATLIAQCLTIDPDLSPLASAMLPIALERWKQQQYSKAEEVEPTYIRNRVTD